jgi:hypothetical protein
MLEVLNNALNKGNRPEKATETEESEETAPKVAAILADSLPLVSAGDSMKSTGKMRRLVQLHKWMAPSHHQQLLKVIRVERWEGNHQCQMIGATDITFIAV